MHCIIREKSLDLPTSKLIIMTKHFLLSALISLFTSSTLCAQNKIIELWPDSIPGALKAKSEHKLDKKTEKNVIRLVEVTNPTLEVCEPQGPKNGMAVVVCPGGGYHVLAYNKEGTEIAEWLIRQGFTAFTLAYRVPNQREGALQDVQRAIRYVRSKYGFSKVGVIGFSAGASLSARAATRFNTPAYPAMDDIDTTNCRPDFAALIYPAYLADGEGGTLTPELTVSKQTPPTFIFGTADDFYSSNSSLVYAQAMRKEKAPIELHYLNHGGHGYGMRYGVGLLWPTIAEEWLRYRAGL